MHTKAVLAIVENQLTSAVRNSKIEIDQNHSGVILGTLQKDAWKFLNNLYFGVSESTGQLIFYNGWHGLCVDSCRKVLDFVASLPS